MVEPFPYSSLLNLMYARAFFIFPRNTSRKEKSLAKRTLSRYEYREFDAPREKFNRCGLDTPECRPGTRIWKCSSTPSTRQDASASSPINSAARRSNVRG